MKEVCKDELDEMFRARIETVLVSHNTNTPKTLHIPSEEEWMKPLCGSVTKSGKWLDKLTSMYPHRPVCIDCAVTSFDVRLLTDDGELHHNQPKKELVVEYAREHDDATQVEIADEIGVHRGTVCTALGEAYPEHPTVTKTGANSNEKASEVGQ